MHRNRLPKNKIKIIFELSKLRITQFITLSTASGYLLAKKEFSPEIFPPVFGIFFMACGSAALNQFQEHQKDALMRRTKNRPIPSGRISPKTALIIALVLLMIGLIILFTATNITALSLGILTVIWYNGVYTYLKRVTPLAVIPGSLIGALPPLVGWASSGKSIFSIQSMALAFFFFIWQIPHFWLLLLNFGQDYENAGYPALTSILSTTQLGRLTFIWIVMTATVLVVLPFFGLGQSTLVFLLLLITSISLIIKSLKLLKASSQDFSFRPAFRTINLFIIAAMFLLTLDRLIYKG
jgi:protoheme IX farnesyltransferase